MPATLEVMPRRAKDETEVVRLNKALAKKARLIAAWLDMSLPDYLAARFAHQIETEWTKTVEQMRKDKPKD